MKNRNLILSVCFWLVSTALMAVSLPSSSYFRNSYGSSETYQAQMGTGVSINGYSVVGSGEYDTSVCTTEGEKGDPTVCQECCEREVLVPCEDDGGDYLTCGALNTECIKSCTDGTSLPLDAPTAFLLALVAAYGAVAVYRRCKVQEA